MVQSNLHLHTYAFLVQIEEKKCLNFNKLSGILHILPLSLIEFILI